MATILLLLLLGFALLLLGGELLVRGATRLAERLGLSPMLVGLVIVGLGTSTPELAASVQAALAGSPGIAIGNIVGSNIANILLILGLTAIIYPISASAGALWRDGLVGVAGVGLMLLAGTTVGLSLWVGFAFLAVLIAYLTVAYQQERVGEVSAASQRTEAVEHADPGLHVHETGSPAGLVKAIALFVVGIAIIVAGGTILVDNAIAIAARLGVSDEVIGLTIVAFGTSAPELATSAIAAFRKESDIALGNVLGSNIYNIFFIGGVTGIVAPGPIPGGIMTMDLWVLLAASIVAIGFAWTGGRLGRREGGVLVAAYVGFILFTAGLI
ncbi:calcium/sodium antiporter [Qipengyuania sp. XHP0207]|uniref:calcium/sodium antiporter n=1 Tax=Qipengyuania sp. XHP0207 TaxID=3038078 RepID=UPI00241E4314|nr:calcium/sodium antiporter [Qipengyuania sp. XHP0207]MDG5747140.1 calcium/sodium antiporter [Qipengyuania sp. XHP0207]